MSADDTIIAFVSGQNTKKKNIIDDEFGGRYVSLGQYIVY